VAGEDCSAVEDPYPPRRSSRRCSDGALVRDVANSAGRPGLARVSSRVRYREPGDPTALVSARCASAESSTHCGSVRSGRKGRRCPWCGSGRMSPLGPAGPTGPAGPGGPAGPRRPVPARVPLAGVRFRCPVEEGGFAGPIAIGASLYHAPVYAFGNPLLPPPVSVPFTESTRPSAQRWEHFVVLTSARR
jgi:hypothetical protein